MLAGRRHSFFSYALTLALMSLVLSACSSPSEQAPSEHSPAMTGPVVSTQTPQTPDDPTEATIDGVSIARSELVKPLIDAYGLNMLLKLVELDLAKQQATRMGITVPPAEIASENQRYIEEMFKDDKRLSEMRDQMDQQTRSGKAADAGQTQQAISKEQQRLLNQLLDNKRLTRTEFDLAMETNAYLRAIVQPAVAAKLTEENLQESFRARYGEKVQVRHIALGNMQEVAEAKRKLADGEPFSQVAMEMSRNAQTRPLGGELQPFSRMTPGLPQVFKDTAFSLQKVGDISDVVQAEGAYHLIQLMGKIAPTAVKFEDVRESVKQDLNETLIQASIRDLRTQLGQIALRDLQIADPVLRDQFQAKVTQRDEQVQGKQAVRDAMKSDRPAAAAPANPPAATEPARSATAPPASTDLTTRP